MKEEFEYKVSVIVPVYNAEEYLRGCLDSILDQTIPQEEVEVLLINDGSTDLSVEICEEYCRLNENFRLFSKENEGLSATRNYGVKRAKGKYIAYLDSDDKYSKNTLENVCNFFDLHYDEIDEVSIPIVRYKNGKSLPLHFRYKYEVKTGVYDLDNYPFVSQTNINVIVKNKRENNVLFDTTPNFRHEDQAYNNEILSDKMKIGFVKEAEYKYNRDNETSIINTYMYPLYIFETSIAYYESIFSKYEKVPKYYQAMFFNDLNWKLCEDKLWPFHYADDEFKNAHDRIKALLCKVDPEIIIQHPATNTFHIAYWLAMKPNCMPVVLAEKNNIRIMEKDKEIYRRDNFEVILHKFRVNNLTVRVLGFVKSPVYNYINQKADLFIVKNGIREKIDNIFPSVHSYYKCQYTKTNNFWAFDIDIEILEDMEISFEVDFEGISYPTKFWCMPVSVFDDSKKLSQYVRENILIQNIENRKIQFKLIDREKTAEIEDLRTEYYKSKQLDIFKLRKMGQEYRNKHRVWLYYDAYTVKKDNGFLQFINDFEHDDGIEKYYILTNPETMLLFNDNQKKNVVEFGGFFHKVLYIAAERVFTAFYGFSTISPFKSEYIEADYADLLKFKTIYLQHGVLHAGLKTYNAVERCRTEQIVVSSDFEVQNYIKNYNYRREDLIPVGMARYDFIDREKESSEKRILYAPSWRKYLTFSPSASNWVTVVDKLYESDYFKGIMDFLTSERLDAILNEYDINLDVKLHPIICKDIENLIPINSLRINVVAESDEVHVEDYSIFITDFSSYVFDYACLSRPIIYYVTDYIEFKSGMNHYKELDLPFDKAFGNMYTESDSVIDEIEHIAKNGYVAEEVFKYRMDNFFVPLDNCREKLYRWVMDSVNSNRGK